MKIYFVFARFSAISLLTAVLDYLLFIGLYYVSGRIVSSAIIARLVSGALNFRLNQRLTFRKQADTTKAILKYASLAICLALASSLLTIGFKNIGINVYTGKIISECILFIVSFSIQKLFIFNLKHER